MIKNPQIDRILDVSTFHISKKDDSMLEKIAKDYTNKSNVIVISHDYGFFVLVTDDIDEFSDFSSAFQNIMAEAKNLNCKWVNFDVDGTEYEFLTTFSW